MIVMQVAHYIHISILLQMTIVVVRTINAKLVLYLLEFVIDGYLKIFIPTTSLHISLLYSGLVETVVIGF